MIINKCMLTNNDCYKLGAKMIPVGIVVHSTGANNPTLKRYIQPDDGVIGKNTNNNDWNRPRPDGIGKCVHGFIGKDKNGVVRFYQTLPFNIKPWGCGTGTKGSYNNSYIQFEICEDALSDEKYFNEAFSLAIEVCKYLMSEFGIKVNNVVSHAEAHKLGYASNHGDCDHWLKKFGKDMNWFRQQLTNSEVKESATTTETFKVKVARSDLWIRKGAGTNYSKIKFIAPGVYTITEVKSGKGSSKGWGRLKSGAGWISLDFAMRV